MSTPYNRNVLESILDSFVISENFENEIKVVESIEAIEPMIVDDVVDTKCITGCKKKLKADCIHKMCFTCCCAKRDQDEVKTLCPGHYAQNMKKEEEDRLIVEGMKSLSRQKTKFYHFEEKFMDFGQTVVIWCFQDFCNNPEWNADTFAQSKRQERSKQLLQKLRGGEFETLPVSVSTSDISTKSDSNQQQQPKAKVATSSSRRKSTPVRLDISSEHVTYADCDVDDNGDVIASNSKASTRKRSKK